MTKSGDEVSNLNFTGEEMTALCDREFFRVKDAATKKILGLFSVLELGIKAQLKSHELNVNGLNVTTGKIFRGENYRLYPYVVLDYPKLFSADSIFAFRSMFWWGHEFSFTMHLQGEAWMQYEKLVIENFNLLLNNDVFYCVNDNPWQYYFAADNYLPVEKIIPEKKTGEKPFIKLSRKIDPGEAGKTVDYGLETFNLFASLLRS